MNIEPPKSPLPGAPVAPPIAPRIVDDPEAFELIDLLRRWQPMGYRVVIKMPYISDDKSPIFGIVVNPFLPTMGTDVYDTYSPIFPLPTYSTGKVTQENTDIAVQAVRYDGPTPLSLVTTAHRFWSGSLKYRLRVVSGAFSQGYLCTGILRGTQPRYLWKGSGDPGLLKNMWRNIPGTDDTYRSFMMNGYLMSDLSLYRHVEIEAPYMQLCDVFNQSKFLANLSVNTNIQPELQPVDVIMVGVRGAMAPTSGTTELIIELEYAAGDDFVVAQELNIDFLQWNATFSSDSILTYPQKFVPKPSKKGTASNGKKKLENSTT